MATNIKTLFLSLAVGAALTFLAYRVVKKRKPRNFEPSNNKEDQSHNPFLQ